MPVNLSRRDELAVITLDRQEALNALSAEIVRDFGAAIEEVGRSDARGLIVTGAGDKAFCAGADIRELIGRPMSAHRRTLETGQRTFAMLERIAIPSVALINGYAFGGGLEIALACTFRLATPTAKMGLPEIKLANVPGYGGTQRLPRLIGENRALEMIMTGRTVAVAEAERIGLVNRVVEGEPMEAAIGFIREIVGHSLPVLELARQAVTRALDLPLHEGFKLEADLATLAYQTADSHEGFTAFADKRKPEFKDE